jgi:hypothetical protein
MIIAGAQQIFHKNFFLLIRKTSLGSEIFCEKFAGRQQYQIQAINNKINKMRGSNQ